MMTDEFRKARFDHVCISTMDSNHQTIEDHLAFAAAWLHLVR